MSEKSILVIEPSHTKRQALTPEVRESIRSLTYNPGFQYLMNELALARAFLRKQLEDNDHSSLREVDRIQIGLQWSKWFEERVKQIALTEPPKEPARQLRKSEMELLEEIRRNIIPGPINSEGTDSATRP